MNERLVRWFYDEQTCWYPTLDLLQRSNAVSLAPYLGVIVQHEEWMHRILYLRTLSRLETSWTEALSSFETLSLISEAVRLKEKHPDFVLYLPLALNEQRHDIPVSFRTKIRGIRAASQLVNRHLSAWGDLVESFTLTIQELGGDPNAKPGDSWKAFKRYRKLKLAMGLNLELYGRVKRLYKKIRANAEFLGLGRGSAIEAVEDLFFWIDGEPRNEVPPLALSDCLAALNDSRIRNIRRRTNEALDFSLRALKRVITGKRPRGKLFTYAPSQVKKSFLEYATCGEALVRALDWMPSLLQNVFKPVNALSEKRIWTTLGRLRPRDPDWIRFSMFSGGALVWYTVRYDGSVSFSGLPGLHDEEYLDLAIGDEVALYKEFLLTGEMPHVYSNDPLHKTLLKMADERFTESLKIMRSVARYSLTTRSSSSSRYSKLIDMFAAAENCLELR